MHTSQGYQTEDFYSPPNPRSPSSSVASLVMLGAILVKACRSGPWPGWQHSRKRGTTAAVNGGSPLRRSRREQSGRAGRYVQQILALDWNAVQDRTDCRTEGVNR
jgi:hypothetical protein